MSKKMSAKRLPSLTIAIPAYNEEENIRWVINDTLRDAPQYLSDFEIVIIDDGSTDQTGTIADRFAKKDKRIRVIHQSNGGYGIAMLRGIKEAKKEFVCYMPADGQFLVRDMRHCFVYMAHEDLILGYRGPRTDYSMYRHILSHNYLLLLRLLFGLRYRDVNWLTIWRTREVQKLTPDSRGIFLLAEIVIRFKRKGFRIVEAPSFYRPRRGGKVKNAKPSIVLRTFIDALRMWSR